ncbi:MAG: 3-phosphoshikimate 1-carboxyvinyltransferase [Methanoregulaceae archaeon PtaU1.Bin059]|nr:MAG: 3-phosphoshikimate 1-carboxyvinyltransferase [Methanoregulaceae archaeon PtaU1.Bin059]
MEVTLRKAGDVYLNFRAPPSKSYTHRALIAASLALGDSIISNPLEAEDIAATSAALVGMGVQIMAGDRCSRVRGTGGTLSCAPGLVMDMQNSGTSMRLLTSVALLCKSPVVLTGSPRMKERPLGPLADALTALGGRIEFMEKAGFPPVKVSGRLTGGQARVDAGMSSQFVSSILMAAPYAHRDVILDLDPGVASPSYLDVTLSVMEAFGATVEREGYRRFQVAAGIPYRARTYEIEGDYSSASYFFALAALCGGRVRVGNLNPTSCQGDRRFLAALESMGCRVSTPRESVEVSCDGDLDGIEIDMSSSPDTVQTLCMVAAKARSPTRISGIAHLKWKESDRLESTTRLLRSLGGDVTVEGDALIIRPAPLHGGRIDPGDDHRTAMSFTVLGLSMGNVKITQAECVSKSFPGFWEQLAGQGLV